jgi:hypothetical protein
MVKNHALHELYVGLRPWRQARSRRRRQRFTWGARRTRLHDHGLGWINLLCTRKREEASRESAGGEQCTHYNSRRTELRFLLTAKPKLPPVGRERNLHLDKTNLATE